MNEGMSTFRIKLKSCSVCTEGDKGCGAEVAETRVFVRSHE